MTDFLNQLRDQMKDATAQVGRSLEDQDPAAPRLWSEGAALVTGIVHAQPNGVVSENDSAQTDSTWMAPDTAPVEQWLREDEDVE